MTEEKNFSSSSSLTLVYDTIRWEEKALHEAALKKGINIINLDCKNLSVNLNHDKDIFNDKIILQRCVSYFKNLHSTSIFEGLGAKVVNSLYTATMCGNKLFTHMELQKNGIKTPNVITSFSGEAALKSIREFGYPVVIKPTIGSWGRLISLLRDEDAAKAVIEDREHMFPLYHIFYLEEFIDRPPRDIRAIVVGEQVVAAIYRYSDENEWKTNMALGGRAEICPITKELEDVCIKATKSVKGIVVGVDLMESRKDGLLVHEVNNTTEFKNTVRVTGVNIPEKIIDHILNEKE